MSENPVAWWEKIKANGWEPDATSIRGLLSVAKAHKKEHDRITATIDNEATMTMWNTEFGAEVAARDLAIAEMEARLSALENSRAA